MVQARSVGVAFRLLAFAASLWLPAAAWAETPEMLAKRIGTALAAACPAAAPGDAAALTACANALRGVTAIPFASRIVWGGAQSDLRVRQKSLTVFRPQTYQLLYLPLFWFTGVSSVRHDARDDVDVVSVEAYFRNALPPGDYPYPFWHSAAKWTDYERANTIDFYLNKQGKVFAVTRNSTGSEAARGPYAAHTPPTFDGNWQWQDAAGNTQPAVSLFANRYSATNPTLPALDKSYRKLALALRAGTCIECHTPANKAAVTRLILLQTPLHAAGMIDDVLKQVRSGDMPENQLGEKVTLDDATRAALLTYGKQFSDELAAADRWETQHRSH